MSWDNLKPPAKVWPASDVLIQSVNASKEAERIEAELRADGFVQYGSGEWQKHIAPTDGWGAPFGSADLHKQNAAQLFDKPVDQITDEERKQARVMTTGLMWGSPPRKPEYVEGPDSWPVNAEDAGRVEELCEAVWTANALDSAVTKAGVVNALNGTKDEFNIDQDGELTRMKEIVSSTQPGPHGYYVAYHNGRWLHAILSGPYDTQADAYLRADAAYDKMINDAAFKLAFENKFERAGIYCAQIPLSARRKGAYGVIDG